MRIGIGIDTGGTYTDAVVYDFDAGEVIAAAKALTTREDLSIGILEALDKLPRDKVAMAEVISLSTTLATNACVEDKGGSAKLIFFGGDRKVIDTNGSAYGLPPSKDMYIQESHTTFSGGFEREVDWAAFNAGIAEGFDGLDGVGIIEANAIRNSAVVEKKARELFAWQHDIPVVCSHELFNELNCLQRGASTLLNARLVPVIREFLQAINTAMAARGLDAAVAIVRSDGSLMTEAFARVRPVETLLCGPAASVLGSASLANEPNSIVVDMGGTTTDIALIEQGRPVKTVDGVRVGKWKTFVDGLYIHTFGLGGDTAIHYDGTRMILEDYRVVPLCVAAEKYPQVVDNLQALLDETSRHSRPLHEHYLLMRDIADNPRYTDEEKAFCTALKDGPLILRQAGEVVPGKDMYNLNTARLLKEGVVQLCGLTPTDIMHIRGDFCRFPAEASMLAARFVASNLETTVEELCSRVYDEIKRRLYVNIVKALLERRDSRHRKQGISKEVEHFIHQAYDFARTGHRQGGLSMMFSTDFVLTGVGAPIRIFLEDVAAMLGTKAVIPRHYEVANALGAVVGNVYADSMVEIRPIDSAAASSGYRVYGLNETREFKALEDAQAFALDEAGAAARAEAVRRGAVGEITVTCRLKDSKANALGSVIYLGTQAIAQAVGSMGFGRGTKV